MNEDKFLELIYRIEINIHSYKAIHNKLIKKAIKTRIIELSKELR